MAKSEKAESVGDDVPLWLCIHAEIVVDIDSDTYS